VIDELKNSARSSMFFDSLIGKRLMTEKVHVTLPRSAQNHCAPHYQYLFQVRLR
jgi:hypothetical protein